MDSKQESPAALTPPETQTTNLMEQMVGQDIWESALRHLESKGPKASGVDGMELSDLRPYLEIHGEAIKDSLLSGSYAPQPVKRVEIDKPDGGKRKLGIPTYMDRLIQMAMVMALTPIFDPGFSDNSYGFRPGRNAQQAIRKAREYVTDGYNWVVNLDLKEFFNTLSHDTIVDRVARRISDPRILQLIQRYLKAGVKLGIVIEETPMGSPQGGPLSPLLANIVLDDLDKWLERQNLKAIRYADDCNIYVQTEAEGLKLKVTTIQFLERLRLTVNQEKSKVDRPWKRKYLGFRITEECEIVVAPESVVAFKEKIQEITSTKHQSIGDTNRKVQLYVAGWKAYYSIAATPELLRDLDAWLRRHMLEFLWRKWGNRDTRKRELAALGLNSKQADKLAYSKMSTARAAKELARHHLNWMKAR